MKNRMLAILMCCVMIAAMLPVTAFAEDTGVAINETNFPDAIFRKVASRYDTDGDGVLSNAEIRNVTYIDCRGKEINDLKGIEYFTALTNLGCSNNQLTALDVRKNTALTSLDCRQNRLTVLDVSSNTALTHLDCGRNQLTALDVSKNTALTYLNCYSNQLTALDVSKNTELKSLNCSGNQLTALDVSSHTALTYLNCYSNQLTALDVSSNTKLISLDCYMNQLTALDVSKNTALTYLNCYSNQLTALDVSKNTELKSLNCSGNQLTALDVSSNTALTSLDCYMNQLTALDVSSNTKLISLNCSDNQLTALDISNTKLIYFGCIRNEYMVSVSEDETFDLSTLPGSFDMNKASNWVGGSVAGNILTLDNGVSKVTYKYDCGLGKSETFTLSSYSSYASVEINSNNFPDAKFREVVSEFDTDGDNVLSGVEIGNVRTIYCSDLNISALKGIEYFTALTYLVCYSNRLTALDVSKKTALKWLNCGNNRLTALDINNTALEYLNCSNNRLTALDSSNTALAYRDCSGNEYMVYVSDDETFDLSTLPGSFDVSKTSDWVGGSVAGNILTLDKGVSVVTYKYDCGWANPETFTLVLAQISGDVNGDGILDAKDLLYMRRYVADVPVGIELDMTAADMDGDGEVTPADCLLLRKTLAGVIDVKAIDKRV